ncbi:1-acyl-sn-glycerol-3-phosphate acyltransferase [Kovacikia minuta CCNUW1]|uniref:1-acyl-sn-glycerol-3-phosphate acyltransferase n=1 Tax=Kovacikia minuta TaxID=2931930 RepID=UPI001CC94E46|nr:1-acyl-sn-glycerol-3-phosphate acyltransferase [Kovacikia minuta]UBF23917.1 1-acyl-sn-glycerol-3-phosphate acyltransferase [Kovacikia minuta CCNUW1]
MPDFYPPRLTPIFVKFCQTSAPVLARWHYWVHAEIDSDGFEQLLTLKNQRLLLLPNHPTFQDLIVIFLLSGKLGVPFYYLAAYENFKGILGAFLQRLGTYSIRRAIADRASIAQTLELLSQSNGRLVIFPEGGCSFQNDTVMPFRVGGVQIAFQALNRFAKRGEPIPDLYVIPVSIKYHYTEDTNPIIQRALTRLEKALEIAPDGNEYDRLRTIAEQVLRNIEREYNLYTPETNQQSWNDRITALKAHVLQECEQLLGIRPSPNELLRERVYRIQYAIRDSNELDDKFEDAQPPETLQPSIWTVEAVEKAMFRLLNFDAIYDGYVAANPTPERFLDTVTRLEREVFQIDQPPPKGHRKARVKVGEPINLREHFDAYQKNRSGVVNQLVLQIQKTVQQNLDLLR